MSGLFSELASVLPSPNPAVLFQPVAEGAVLLNPEQEIYFGLNAVGAQVWQLLPPVCNDIHEVCADLLSRYPDVGMDVIRTDVEELLQSLLNEGLVLPATKGG